MSRPFSPDEALSAKAEIIPPFVIDAVNQLLAQRYDGRSCTIRQQEVIGLARTYAFQQYGKLDEEVTSEIFFSEHWLDFETIYRKNGWKVTYDKPGYNESYEPSWSFERDGLREGEAALGRRW